MADYEYDIFVSYRRSSPEWVRWTKENFARALDGVLRPGIPNLRVFIDEQLEKGSSWPIALSTKLARSRLLVPVLSRDYFQSEWCRTELALMCHREKQCGLRCNGNPSGIVMPVVIDDGDCFPQDIKAMLPKELHRFANPFMLPDSPKQEQLADELLKIKSDFENAHSQCPLFDAAWEQIAHAEFQETFKITAQTQTTVPPLKLRTAP